MPVCPWFGLARHRRSPRSKLFANFESRACIRISCYLESMLKVLLVRIGFCTTVIDALHAFYCMPKCLNWRNILSWIPFGSDLDPNSDNVFSSSFFKRERIQISLKAGHHRPASETPLNGVLLACRWWPNVECWLGSFENFKRSGPVLLRNSIFLLFFRRGRGPDPLSPLWIRAWDRIMYTLIEIYWKPIL